MFAKNRLSDEICTALLDRFSEYKGRITFEQIVKELSEFNPTAVDRYCNNMPCDCYRVVPSERTVYSNFDNRFHTETDWVGRCLGTKEMDICSCEGNKNKCSFYKEK